MENTLRKGLKRFPQAVEKSGEKRKFKVESGGKAKKRKFYPQLFHRKMCIKRALVDKKRGLGKNFCVKACGFFKAKALKAAALRKKKKGKRSRSRKEMLPLRERSAFE